MSKALSWLISNNLQFGDKVLVLPNVREKEPVKKHHLAGCLVVVTGLLPFLAGGYKIEVQRRIDASLYKLSKDPNIRVDDESGKIVFAADIDHNCLMKVSHYGARRHDGRIITPRWRPIPNHFRMGPKCEYQFGIIEERESWMEDAAKYYPYRPIRQKHWEIVPLQKDKWWSL